MRATSDLDFHGQTVIVTGSGAGLGRRYALDLAAAGARVVVNARRAPVADAVVRDITQRGGEAAPAVVDARDGQSLVDVALHAFGCLDALVVNAAILRDRTFARMSNEEWDEVVDTTLGGACAVARAAWSPMSAQSRGRVVFTTSGAGLHGTLARLTTRQAKRGSSDWPRLLRSKASATASWSTPSPPSLSPR